MSDRIHDTVDLEEELGDIESVLADPGESLGDIDEVLADGPLRVAKRQRHTSLIELVLVTLANGIWAVVGLVLWLPQTVRAVLWAALRTVHAALTHQSSSRAVAGIQRVSRSYVDRFLSRGGAQSWVGRRHELRPFRLVGEIAWTVGFYLLLLRWLAPDDFAPVWAGLVEWSALARGGILEFWGGAKHWLSPDLADLDLSRAQVAGILLGSSFLGLMLGYWLGRRRR